MDVLKIVRPRTLGDLIAKEWDPDYDTETGILRSGVGIITIRTVLGQQTVAALAGAITALANNTGNPTFSAVTVAAGTEPGEYDVIMTSATKFQLLQPPQNPNDTPGEVVAAGVFGTAFNAGGVGFTFTAGGTACVAGDGFKLTVAATPGDNKLSQINFSATDGSQNAMGVSCGGADSTSGDAPIAYKARGPLIIRAEEIIWPAGATTNQIAAATAQLAQLSPPILVRASG